MLKGLAKVCRRERSPVSPKASFRGARPTAGAEAQTAAAARNPEPRTVVVASLVALSALLSACTGQWQSPGVWVANTAPVVSSCPAELVEQSHWVRNNLTRVPLGGSRQQVAQILGLPLQVESFLLADGSPVDVLFYPTPEGACSVRPYNVPQGVVSGQSGLVPLVFQHDRLMGYGQGYYQQAVVPNLRTTLQYPANQRVPYGNPAGVGRGQPLNRR